MYFQPLITLTALCEGEIAETRGSNYAGEVLSSRSPLCWAGGCLGPKTRLGLALRYPRTAGCGHPGIMHSWEDSCSTCPNARRTAKCPAAQSPLCSRTPGPRSSSPPGGQQRAYPPESCCPAASPPAPRPPSSPQARKGTATGTLQQSLRGNAQEGQRGQRQEGGNLESLKLNGEGIGRGEGWKMAA